MCKVACVSVNENTWQTSVLVVAPCILIVAIATYSSDNETALIKHVYKSYT